MNANDVDNRLLAGDLQVDLPGTGVQAAARARILSSPSLKASADNPLAGFIWFAAINTTVAPLNNMHCRMAVEYAANKIKYQNAYGGPIGGAIASTVAPPNVVGQKPFDLYEATTQPGGDGQGQAATAALRPAERLHHRDHLPQRPAQGGRGRPGAAGLAGPGRHQDHAARLPDRHLRRQLRGRA